jgi:hypothetical protein
LPSVIRAKEIAMDSKKIALILPFAGLTGFGLANLGGPSSGFIPDAQAECESVRDDNDECYCVGDDASNNHCSVSITITKDGKGNVISESKTCSESPGCEC